MASYQICSAPKEQVKVCPFQQVNNGVLEAKQTNNDVLEALFKHKTQRETVHSECFNYLYLTFVHEATDTLVFSLPGTPKP